MNEFNLSDIPAAFASIADVIREPTSNLTAAALLLAIVTTVLLMAIVGLLLFLSAASRADEGGQAKDAARGRSRAATGSGATRPRPARSPRARIAVTITAVLFLGVLWVVTAATTSASYVCISCHADRPHVEAAAMDPHTDVACVECHEPGNVLSRVTYELPSRAWHVVEGGVRGVPAVGYGIPIGSQSCTDCHADQIAGTIRNEQREIRVSHAEPLEAGAECVDCHALELGMVSRVTVGMDPCLRCHNGTQAESGCGVCHDGDPARAIRSRPTTEAAFVADQVPVPRCGGCHDEVAEGCDGCHGLRMPHSREFMAFDHARYGVEDLWYNDGAVCGKCHFAERRPCQRCHSGFLAHGEDWQRLHGQGVGYSNPCGCHQYMAYSKQRNFCGLCHEVAR